MKKTKKVILHISHTDIRYDGRILKELNSIVDLVDCNVIAFGIDDKEGHQYIPQSELRIEAFKLLSKKWYFLPRPIRYFINYWEAFIKMIIPGLKVRPDVIHCHDTLFLPIALLIKLLCNSKLIYDAHELESQKNGQTLILSKITLLIEKIVWSKIDLLIAVSPSIITWYKSNFSEKESLIILNAPSIKTEFKNERSKNLYLKEKFNIPNNQKVFLYLGIIGPGRGIEFCIEAFKRKDIESHIVFMGYGEFVDKVKELELKFPNIHFHPSVPHNEVVSISKSADVGLCLVEAVSLSDYFCLPNKLFEYAFSGLPILASDFPDMKQLVEQYNLGRCCKLEDEEVFNGIKYMEQTNFQLGNRDLYPLSWAFQAEKLILGYKKILNN